MEESCPYLSRLLPGLIDNSFRIVLDSLFPPPMKFNKKNSWIERVSIENNFELVFNEAEFNKSSNVIL